MGGAIRAEIRKIFTTRLWWGLLLALVVISGGLSALYASLVGQQNGQPGDNPFAIMTKGTAQLIYSAGISSNLTPLVPLALGVILITQEFRHQTITATVLATPRRAQLIAAKVVALIVIGVVYGVVHDVASGAFGALVLGIKGQPTYFGTGDTWETFGVSLLVFVLWGLIGFGFGLLVRNQLAAVFLALGIAFIAHIALSLIFGALNWDTPPKFLPDNLSVAMLVTSDPVAGGSSGGSPYFGAVTSGLILLGYAIVLTGIGGWLLARRDVS